MGMILRVYNSGNFLNPLCEAAKFLAQAFGFGGVVVLNGVLKKGA